MPGRKPKPTAIRELQGNAGHRPLNHREPKFTGMPTCPSWLAPDARAEWKRIAHELAELDLLKSTDQAALAAYCVAYDRWQSAERIVTDQGQTISEPVVSKSGDVVGHKIKRHPASIIARDERTSMLKAASLFGFDPSSRSRIVMPEDKAPTQTHDDFNLYADPQDSGRVIH